MARLINLMVTFILVGVMVFSAAVGLKTGNHSGFSSRLSETQGTVLAFEAGLMLVEFDGEVINTCGDTQIFAFASTPSNNSVQLKPVFIPEAKAKNVNTTTLIFPVWDVMAFFQDEGAYTIEFYVHNNCSLLFNKTITLPPVPLVLGGGDKS